MQAEAKAPATPRRKIPYAEYYESDGCYFKHTDEFFARPEIEEINRKLPSFCQINITENS